MDKGIKIAAGILAKQRNDAMDALTRAEANNVIFNEIIEAYRFMLHMIVSAKELSFDQIKERINGNEDFADWSKWKADQDKERIGLKAMLANPPMATDEDSLRRKAAGESPPQRQDDTPAFTASALMDSTRT